MSFISKNVHSYNIKTFGVFRLVYKWLFLVVTEDCIKIEYCQLAFFFTYCELFLHFHVVVTYVHWGKGHVRFSHLFMPVLNFTQQNVRFSIFLCPSSILHNKMFFKTTCPSQIKLGWHTLQTIEVLSTGHNFIVSWN